MNPLGDLKWVRPCQVVMCQDKLVREVISPARLQAQLGLHFLHPRLLATMDTSLTQCCQALGVSCLSVEHLLHIAVSLTSQWGQGEQLLGENCFVVLACGHLTVHATD